MGGSYRQCDACGKRALSIAVRCPGCGREFPATKVPKDDGGLDLRRFLTPQVVAAVAVVAVLGSANVALTGQPTEEKAEVGSSLAGGLQVETTGTVQGRAVSTGPVETARVAALPAEGGRGLRVARSWTEVRQSRSVRAPVEAVLTPGDTVLADSLAGGWYRVALEGEVLGYAHRSKLAALGVAME